MDQVAGCSGQREHPADAAGAADKGYDVADFVTSLRNFNAAPHVAQNTTHRSAIDRRMTRHLGYAASQRLRKWLEEGFGCIKTMGNLKKTRHQVDKRGARCRPAWRPNDGQCGVALLTLGIKHNLGGY